MVADDINSLHRATTTHGGSEYTDLEAQINAYGEYRYDRYSRKFVAGIDGAGHTEYRIGSWARGPLVRIESFHSDGEQRTPTLSNGLVKNVLDAGYVPWGFREDRNEDGVFMWYLRPIADVANRDRRRDVIDEEIALVNDDGSYVRNGSGDLVTFDSAEDAAAVADDDQAVRGVIQ